MVSHFPAKNNHADVQIVQASNAEIQTNGRPAALRYLDDPDAFTANNLSQSVIFQSSRVWSRAIAWGIMGLVVAGIGWAAVARIDEAIPADGKLEPLDDAKKIQAPMSGVVKQVYVKNGDRVKAGDILLRLESIVPESQMTYLENMKASLAAENSFYRSQINSSAATVLVVKEAKIQINPEVLALTKSRNALVAENQLYRSEMSGRDRASLTPEQRNRLQSSMNELNTRLSAGKLEIAQVQRQSSENRVRRQGLVNQLDGIKSNISSIAAEIANGRDVMSTGLEQIDRQISQNQSRISAAQKTLSINQSLLAGILPAAAAGAIASAQVQRQEQEIINRTSELEQQIQEQGRLKLEKKRLISVSTADTQRQQQRRQEQHQLIKQRQSEIGQLDQEYLRLQLSANQGIEKLNNNVAVSRKDLFSRVADNDKKIAEIDSQLNKSIVENDRKIAEITNQLTQARQSLKYQEIRSPVDGEVFELKAYQDGLVSNNSPDALVQVIPKQDVMAKVYITNKDIGFVKVGQPVDVRIDTFNFSEFGDVKGTIEWIGSDALPPDQQNPYARFPAKIKLVQQNLMVKGELKQLKPGSSLKANIKLRDRPVLSLLTDMFAKQSDGLKTLR
jgi:hemolysin D